MKKTTKNNSFVKALICHQIDNGYDADDVCKRIGISKTTYFNHKRDFEKMDVEIFGRYCRVLNFSADEVLSILGIKRQT